MRPLLYVGIPSILGREKEFADLLRSLQKQIKDFGLQDHVLVWGLITNKRTQGGPTITAKRRQLFQKAIKSGARFHVQIDDDDSVHPAYLHHLIEKIKESPKAKVIGYKIRVEPSGETALVSARYKDWHKFKDAFTYAQSPYFKVPIATELWAECMPQDSMIWQEDYHFSKALTRKLGDIDYEHRDEYDIDKFMYLYNAPQGRQNPMTRY